MENKLIKYLKNIEKESEFKSLVHNETRKLYKKYNKYLAYPVSILNAVAGSATVSALYTLQENNSGIFLALGSLNICTAVISTLHNIFKFEDKAQKHDKLANLFSRIQRKISYFLNKNSLTDEEIKLFSENIKYKINGLIDIDIPCPINIENRIKKILSVKKDLDVVKNYCDGYTSRKNKENNKLIQLLDTLEIDELRNITKHFIAKEKQYNGSSYLLEVNTDNMDKKQLYQYIILELNLSVEHVKETIDKMKNTVVESNDIVITIETKEIDSENDKKEHDSDSEVDIFSNIPDDDFYISRTLKRNKWKRSTLKTLEV